MSSQIAVKFFTTNPKYAVTDTPITVPRELKRYGLSEIINHLLGNNEKRIPFDFLVDGQFLRTSIDEFLESNQISTEALLNIEYVESLLPPTISSTYEHDDWISCVKMSHGLIMTGSYDKNIRIWDKSHKCLMEIHAHENALKDLHYVEKEGDQNVKNLTNFELISASEDKSVRLWSVDLNSKSYENTLQIQGHDGSVTSVDYNYFGSRIVSSSWDETIKIWNPEPEVKTESEEEAKPKKNLKRKKSPQDTKIITEPLTTLTGHKGCVVKVIWSKSNPKDMFSGSLDNSVKVWDATTALNVTNLSSDQSVLTLDYSEKTGLLISGHTDYSTRIWDPRINEGVVVKTKFLSHKGWVSCASWCPDSSFNFVTGSYDNSLKVWDIRSSAPLHTVKPHEDRILCVDWSNDLIASGGCDGKLKLLVPPKTA